METKISIYSLRCPIENSVRYIGKTKSNLSVRLSAHLSCTSDNIELNMWIAHLKSNGLKPIIELIEITEEHNWCIREQYWIEKYFAGGNKILNKPLDKNNPFYILREYQKILIRCNYSIHTQKNYCSNFLSFLLAFKGKIYAEITKSQITDYLQSLVETKRISPSYQNTIINAIKFWKEKVCEGKCEFYYISRPRKEYPIRPHLTIYQVNQLLLSIENLKHRTALTLMYSCTLRSSEVVAALKTNINFEEGLLTLRQAKNKKDRIINLSFETLSLLDSYIKGYNPQHYLFEGQFSGEHWSAASLRAVFNRTVQELGYDENLHAHDLRGSGLTHLLDNGVKIENASKMAGHNSINTLAKFYYHYDNATMKEQLNVAQQKISLKLEQRKQLTI